MYTNQNTKSKMDFMTLQRPTFEEMERRRQLRENMSPNRSTTLQRRESMISRGLNAIMRRQSFMGGSKPQTHLKRNDSFFMHSALIKDDRDDRGPSLLLTNDQQEHPLHTITRPSRPNLGRAKSFKYPERVSQIPPAELTRIRSKSQVRPDYYSGSGSSDDPMYTSGSGGSAAGSGKSMLRRNPTFLGSRSNFEEFPKYFQPPPRVLPRRPSPRDVSEPPPGGPKRRQPLPDIFFYGERWQEQESRTQRPAPPMNMSHINNNNNNSSLETPEPPPGSSDIGNTTTR